MHLFVLLPLLLLILLQWMLPELMLTFSAAFPLLIYAMLGLTGLLAGLMLIAAGLDGIENRIDPGAPVGREADNADLDKVEFLKAPVVAIGLDLDLAQRLPGGQPHVLNGAFDGDALRPYNAGPDALLLNYKSLTMRFIPDAAAGVARLPVAADLRRDLANSAQHRRRRAPAR